MNEGKVESIYITTEPAAPMRAVAEVRAVPGRGLEGDRYFLRAGTFTGKEHKPDAEVTLIEMEGIEALSRDCQVEIEAGQARRNIVTRGVALNHLVGREFRVGEAVFRGMRLCEPCGHLEKLTKPGVKAGLIHRGGLRAQIVREGVIRAGETLVVVE